MFDNPELAYEILYGSPLDEAPVQWLSDTITRRTSTAPLLASETKSFVLRNIHNWAVLEPLIGRMSARELVELENFLWRETTVHLGNTLHKTLIREYITSQIEPTSSYHRRQVCGEPLAACRANYCVYSNPNCASRKLREHIRALSSVFNRRSRRHTRKKDALTVLLQQRLKQFDLFGIIVTNDHGAPIAAWSQFDIGLQVNGSDMPGNIFGHLVRFKSNPTNQHSEFVSLHVKATSRKVTASDGEFVVTLLAVQEVDLAQAIVQISGDIGRILSDDFQKHLQEAA